MYLTAFHKIQKEVISMLPQNTFTVNNLIQNHVFI